MDGFECIGALGGWLPAAEVGTLGTFDFIEIILEHLEHALLPFGGRRILRLTPLPPAPIPCWGMYIKDLGGPLGSKMRLWGDLWDAK